MKKFTGLLVQEHRHFGLSNYLIAGLTAIFVFLGPELIYKVFQDQMQSDVSGIRFMMTILAAALVGLNSIVMFSSSLNRDIKTKELWLHNSQSMYTLIGAKIVYHGLSLITLCFIAFLGLFFVGGLIVGTLWQYLIFGIACLIITILFYIFFIAVVLFLIALNTQISRYLGKLSYILVVVIGVFLLELLERFPTISFLKIGRVPLSNFNAYLPTFADRQLGINLYFDFYFVEVVVIGAIVIAIYLLMCKWMERVITR
ncbi:MAG TPA: hypothetical protein VNR38_05760 [Ureibacillus sp.]|nr:hypothetical protein [Ureibacillus sp.]